MRTTIKSRMSWKFSQIQPWAAELAAIDQLKKSFTYLRTIQNILMTCSLSVIFIGPSKQNRLTSYKNMLSSVDPGYVNNLLDEFNTVCVRLEEIGINSLVIVITKDGPIEMGTQKGKQFLRDNCIIMEEFSQYCQGDSSDETKAKLHKRMKIVVSEKPEPKTIEIFNVKNIRGTRKSKESKNLTTIALDSSNIFQKLEANTDGVRNADTDLVKAECKDFDEKYTAMSADDDGDNDNDDNNDNGDNNDDGDDNMDDGEESSVKHKDFTANVDDDDLDGDGDSVLSELDHEDDFENEESDIDTKPSVTDRKIAKAKPSKKSVAKRWDAAKKPVNKNKEKTAGSPWMCELCSKMYKRPEDLRVHMRKHTGETPYVCEFCHKAFRSQGLLRSHKIMHSGVRNFQCNKCGKDFARLTNLKRHEVTQHSDVFPYKCENCGKKFKDPSIYRVHLLTHSETKPFKCDQCGQQFVAQYILDSHRLIHTGEKPWTCETCGAKFRTKRFLTLHHQRVHLKSHYIVISPVGEENCMAEVNLE